MPRLVAKDAWVIDLTDIAAIKQYREGPPNQPSTGYQVHYKQGKTLWLDADTGRYIEDEWLKLGMEPDPQVTAMVRELPAGREKYFVLIEGLGQR